MTLPKGALESATEVYIMWFWSRFESFPIPWFIIKWISSRLVFFLLIRFIVSIILHSIFLNASRLCKVNSLTSERSFPKGFSRLAVEIFRVGTQATNNDLTYKLLCDIGISPASKLRSIIFFHMKLLIRKTFDYFRAFQESAHHLQPSSAHFNIAVER